MSRLYPDEVLKGHRKGVIHLHRLDEPDKGYSTGWRISSLTKKREKENGLKGFLGGVLRSQGRLQREWAGPQALNSFDVYSAVAISGNEITENELKETISNFISTAQSLRNSLSVSLDLKPEATLPMSIDNYVASNDLQTLGVYINRFNMALVDALEHSFERGAFNLVPILNVTEKTDWESETFSRYMALLYLYGYPTIQNYYTGTLHPLYLHAPETLLPEIETTYLRHGGIHGNSDNQGCLSIVTLNLPRLSRLSRTEDVFFEELDKAIELSKLYHESKRKHMENMLAEGKLPETAKHINNLDWHFSAINVLGMNEALLTLIDAGMEHIAGKALTYRLLEHIVRRIEQIQVETGHLYTLEAAPCEEVGTMVTDDQMCFKPLGEQSYYTSSTELPPWHGDDLWDMMEHQKKYHGIYTGGNVFQIHLARGLGYREECKLLLRRILEVFGFNHLKVSPVFSLCNKHGYIFGEKRKCPICGSAADVYTWVDCSPRVFDTISEGLKEANRRRVYSDVKDR